MAALLEQIPPDARFAVIRLRSMGDCVLTTPALALLKSHRPDLVIGVVVEDRFAPLFEGNPDVSEILPPRKTTMLRWRPRAVLNLHGGTRSMVLTLVSGATIRAGFGHHTYNSVYNAKIPRAQEILGEERPVHTAEHLASAMFWMGVPWTEIPRARLTAMKASKAPSSYVVLHPFASRPDKVWPVEKFLAIADRLQKGGQEPIFLAGPGDDPTAFSMHTVLQNASLSHVKSLLAEASMFVGNDSGPAHIAAAFAVPVVALFGPSNPATWSPWRTESRVLTSTGPISGITVEQVVMAIDALKAKVQV